MCRARNLAVSRFDAEFRDLPCTIISPDVGRCRLPMIVRSVVLPEPDEPVMQTNSPTFIENVTSASAWTVGCLPNDLLTALHSRKGPVFILFGTPPTTFILCHGSPCVSFSGTRLGGKRCRL